MSAEPRLFPAVARLEGERVILRPFSPADVDAMGPVLADLDVIRLTGSAHTTAEVAEMAARTTLDDRTRTWYATRVDQPDRLDLALVDRATDACVGEAVINEWSPEDRSANLRILIGPAGRDRGLGSEAVRMLVDHAFAATDLERISLEVMDFNPRARRVYERAGFVEEGRLRGAFRFDGEPVDVIVMALLRSDPRG
ncbi:GNAT family N-acetyltransferase [Clavibacter michiganensis]|uniref:GNAT family N-acetyltransferase n=1 Tax=Clavibacter michiganensis TaxID=28447 RepID=UPI000A37FDB5|nr:GNAT family protein [Clavibacter michiganensis]MDO4099990.1 GNAT family protein [Clavibacter michiganensis]MDO4128025.1 GNAT family protein [Clavibacter michiganensis]NIY59184.1 GNAT family N-acetyltransferase [Clavibacter michiganensis subsp. michiganensis]OUE17698.1 Spermidine N(1)-acetyltransferase [Clavibacter michiganensis subsp. michiganensis]QXP03089.1 GNAT family N-acetyltransferase [Clavibacter michiganensis subsp. michiganensis]